MKKKLAFQFFNKKKSVSTYSNLYKKTDFKPRVNFPEFRWKMAPAVKSQIGGPEAFYLGQLWWRIDSSVKFRRNLSVYTTLGIDIYNNFDFNNPSYSKVPHVRSDIQDYLSEGKNNIARLKLEYIWSPKKDVFARLDFGLLEEMFGGYGGEILYRPFDKNYSANHINNTIKINDRYFKIPQMLLEQNTKRISQITIKEALSFNKSILIENFIVPNRLRLPLSRNILEKYYN